MKAKETWSPRLEFELLSRTMAADRSLGALRRACANQTRRRSGTLLAAKMPEAVMTHETRRAGGCLCGALRYETIGEPMAQGHCYCADCRKASGSGFVPFMNFKAEAIRFEGASREFRSPAWRGGEATRNCCPQCMSLVFGGERGKSRAFTIYAGSLDDPSSFHPDVAIFTLGRPDWAVVPPGFAVFDHLPP
jgi:hypothetical protein